MVVDDPTGEVIGLSTKILKLFSKAQMQYFLWAFGSVEMITPVS